MHLTVRRQRVINIYDFAYVKAIRLLQSLYEKSIGISIGNRQNRLDCWLDIIKSDNVSL